MQPLISSSLQPMQPRPGAITASIALFPAWRRATNASSCTAATALWGEAPAASAAKQVAGGGNAVGARAGAGPSLTLPSANSRRLQGAHNDAEAGRYRNDWDA